MQSAITNPESSAKHFVKITPEQLRLLANSIESFVKNCNYKPGQSVTIPLSEDIVLYWEPNGKLVDVPYTATFEHSVR